MNTFSILLAGFTSGILFMAFILILTERQMRKDKDEQRKFMAEMEGKQLRSPQQRECEEMHLGGDCPHCGAV